MDVGSIAICITSGALICFVFTGIGVCLGRGSKDGVGRGGKDSVEREHRPDYDVTIYLPMRYRRGSRDKRVRQFSDEEKRFVLNNVKRLTRGWERDIMESIVDDYLEGSENE